jgi:hypothetical protein
VQELEPEAASAESVQGLGSERAPVPAESVQGPGLEPAPVLAGSAQGPGLEPAPVPAGSAQGPGSEPEPVPAPAPVPEQARLRVLGLGPEQVLVQEQARRLGLGQAPEREAGPEVEQVSEAKARPAKMESMKGCWRESPQRSASSSERTTKERQGLSLAQAWDWRPEKGSAE